MEEESFLSFAAEEKKTVVRNEGAHDIVGSVDARTTLPPWLTSHDDSAWRENVDSRRTDNSERKARGGSNVALSRLHNEMLSFCRFCSLTKDEMSQRRKAFDLLSGIILQLFPMATVSVFGSQLTKILTPSSDLDMVCVLFQVFKSHRIC